MRRGVGLPKGLIDRTAGGLGVAAGLFEASKKVGPEKKMAGLVHGPEIQPRIAALPGKRIQEGVFDPVEEVGVGAAPGRKPGVEPVCPCRLAVCPCRLAVHPRRIAHRCRHDGMDHHRTGQDGINFVAEIPCREGQRAAQIEVGDISGCMDGCIGPSCAGDRDRAAEKLRKGSLESLLDGRGGRLELPAAEIPAVVGQTKNVTHMQIY